MTFYAAVFDGKRKAYRVKKMNLHTRNGEALYPGPIVLWPRLFGRLKDCLDWINERQAAMKMDIGRTDTGGMDTSNTDTGRPWH
jgi:hypothetical protein